MGTTLVSSATRRRMTDALPSYLVAFLVFGIFCLFLLWPVLTLMSKAFLGPAGFTLEYFSLLFSNQLQTRSMGNSLWIGIGSTCLATIISLPLALLSAKYSFRGKNWLFGLLLLPMVMPPFVGAIGIQQCFSLYGTFNLLLIEMGLISTPIPWLDSQYLFYIVIALEALHLYPILYLNLTAAFSNIDPSLEEMATVFGVTPYRKIKDILIPLATPGFMAGAIVVFIWSFTDLGTPLLVGYHDVIPVRIFNMITDIQENPMGFALVFLVIIFTVLFFLFSRWFLRNGKKYEMLARGHVTELAKPASFGMSILIYTVGGFVLFISLLPHVAVLLKSLSDTWFMTPFPTSYTLDHYLHLFSQEIPFLGMKNSLYYASLSTALDLCLGVTIAYIVVRKTIPASSLLDTLVMIPLALPGIVLAFGYVITFTNTPLDPLQNPVPLLIIAYAIRRLPYMVRSATAGLQQTHIALEEASYLFGASKFHTIRRIVVPILMANLLAGGLLCFSYAMLDVSDSLILAMKDRFFPITKAIYTLYLEQGSGDVSASALGMFAVLFLGASILLTANLLGKRLGELFRS